MAAPNPWLKLKDEALKIVSGLLAQTRQAMGETE